MAAHPGNYGYPFIFSSADSLQRNILSIFNVKNRHFCYNAITISIGI
jgi:hypothetical protein